MKGIEECCPEDLNEFEVNQLVENAIDDYLHRDNIPTKTVVYIKANEKVLYMCCI